MDNKVFAILGGDLRQGHLAGLLAGEGHTVFASGFDRQPQIAAGAVHTGARTAAAMADVVILPVMPTSDGATLSAEFSTENIPLDDELCRCLQRKPVFTGFADRMSGISRRFSELDLREYTCREAFLIKNAQITAEAALMLAIEHMPGAMYESECLITGYGRIGKALAPLLRAMGARVTVAARKLEDFARVESIGLRHINYSRLPSEAHRYDLIVNTADALVLGEACIRNMNPEAIIIDLASRPGGTDFEVAERVGVKAIHALGLPGKYAPRTAARIIMDTVTEMMEEEHT